MKFIVVALKSGCTSCLERERAMSDALNTLIGKKRSQLITLKCRLFTIKVIQICTVESVFMMRTHNLVEHRARRVNVFF